MSDISLKEDGTVSPFDIEFTGKTSIDIMPATFDISEEKETADGETDSGTELDVRTFILHGIIEFTTTTEGNTYIATLTKQFNDCRTPQSLSYEEYPNIYIMVKITRYEITRYPTFLEITAEFEGDPLWYSVTENDQTGSGTITNSGNFETSLTIEITGAVTDPVVTVGDYSLEYTGTVGAGEVLTINTGNKTVVLDGVNTLEDYNDVFPMLQEGDTVVVQAAAGTTVFKWHDAYI